VFLSGPYLRNGALSQINMDNLDYNYLLNVDGRKSNKLGFVTDLQTIATNYPLTNDPIEDIDHQITGYNSDQTSANYSYDLSDNLISDVAEGIDEISWNLAGKNSRIEKSDGTILSYFYNAMGNRIGKSNFDGTNTNFTWYIKDASGNNMGTYNRHNDQGLYIDEFNIYGSSRLGTFKPHWPYPVTSQSPSSAYSTYFNYPSGYKQYELTNHLGNVLTTISNQKTPVNNDSDPETDYFTAIVKTQQDYYPFGMMMPARTYSLGGDYRFGVNGKENDNDVKGVGNSLDFGARIYDSRLGRWMSVDPMAAKFASYSQYIGLDNNPISLVDIGGDSTLYYNTKGLLLHKSFDGLKNAVVIVPTSKELFFF
jgi:RHS repeat-associated protein